MQPLVRERWGCQQKLISLVFDNDLVSEKEDLFVCPVCIFYIELISTASNKLMKN